VFITSYQLQVASYFFMDISIIIVNYKTKGLVRECIKSFKLLKTKVSFEIIVIDNSIDSGLKEILQQRHPDVMYVPLKRNLGLSKGNNIGFSLAKGNYILTCNSDIMVHEGALDALHTHLEENQHVGLVVPRLLHPDGSVQQSYFRFPSIFIPALRRLFLGNLPLIKRHLDWFLMKDVEFKGPTPIDWAIEASWLFRKSLFDHIGTMDERFFLYLEDTDWCKRIWDAGFHIHYIPHAHMTHLYKRESAQFQGLLALRDPLTRIHIISGIKYFCKHWRSAFFFKY